MIKILTLTLLLTLPIFSIENDEPLPHFFEMKTSKNGEVFLFEEIEQIQAWMINNGIYKVYIKRMHIDSTQWRVLKRTPKVCKDCKDI